MSRQSGPSWPAFVDASLALALTAGFGLGGALFAAVALGLPLGLWGPAAAQAHGHVQLFGWAGVMVLGIGFHFLPRLRGAPLPEPGRTRLVLGLLVTGLLLRVAVQPLLALAAAEAVVLALRAGLVLSGVLELVGASLVLRLLAETFRQGPALCERAGLLSVLPFFGTAFAGFWLALSLNLAGLVAAALAGTALVPSWADQLAVQLAFAGFLIPVAIAMSARTFPLYFRTPLPALGGLRLGLALLLVGLALRLWGDLGGVSLPAGLGRLAQAVAVGVFVLGLGVFAPRRPLPREPVRPFADPIQLHALSAYVWLVVAALLLTLAGLAALGVVLIPAPPDAERHAIGAGFITLLILGMAVHLLPGFAGRPLRSRKLIWLTLALGNAVALLRVGPLLLPRLLSPTLASALLALAGLGGLVAIAALAFNLADTRQPIPASARTVRRCTRAERRAVVDRPQAQGG